MVKRPDLPETRRPDPAPAQPTTSQPTTSKAELAAFLAEAGARPPRADGAGGRLIFALDATMSRQPTWDAACTLQGELFRAAAASAGSRSSSSTSAASARPAPRAWVADAAALGRLMTGIACHGGLTQIGRVLDHAAREAARSPVAALAYVGDAMEEKVDALAAKAGELALRGTRAFMFLEGSDPAAERAYREIARMTGGVMLPFDRAPPASCARCSARSRPTPPAGAPRSRRPGPAPRDGCSPTCGHDRARCCSRSAALALLGAVAVAARAALARTGARRRADLRAAGGSRPCGSSRSAIPLGARRRSACCARRRARRAAPAARPTLGGPKRRARHDASTTTAARWTARC